MHLFFIYLLQVNIALALFYLLYAFLLKRDTFIGLRRFFFLSAILFSLLYPFFAIPALGNLLLLDSPDTEGSAVTVLIGEPGMAMVVEGEGVSPASMSRKEIFSLLYIAVSLVFLIRFCIQLFSIYRIRRKSIKRVISGIPVYQLKEEITPFSFFKLIFIHTGKHSESELSQILMHEQTHAHQWHSVDIMLIETVCLLSWWNPFVWLMKREMAINLEYLADNGVLREGVDSREYQYHLLRLTYHETAVQIVNNFNVSQLKQRIMMMNKAKSSTMTLAKYFLTVPLLFLFVIGNSVFAARNEDKTVAIRFAGESPQEATQVIPQEVSQPGIAAVSLPEPPPEEPVNEIFVVVENQPEFPGGEQAMMKYLADNIKYPVIALENGIQGLVSAVFNINTKGKVTFVRFAKSVDPSLDKEVKRVIENMPDWTPAKINGEVTSTTTGANFVFRLQGEGIEPYSGPTPEDAIVVVGYGLQKKD